MKSLSLAFVATALAAGVAAQDFQIFTPNPPTQCVPTQLRWQGGQAPYFLAIVPGGVPGAAALQQYSGLTGTSFTWPTNITAGTSIGLTLTDASGAVAQSSPVTIQSGPSSDCLNGQTGAPTGSTPTDSTTGGSTPTSPTGTTGTTTGTTATGGSNTSKTGGSSGTSTGSTSSASGTGAAGGSGGNGAMSNTASMGVLAVLGAAAAALLA